MPAAVLNSLSGREAALARRRALSAGKTALPPATERVRNGDRSAAVPDASSNSPSVTQAQIAAHTGSEPSELRSSMVNPSQMGRLLSMTRRRQLAGGKQNLPSTKYAPAPTENGSLQSNTSASAPQSPAAPMTPVVPGGSGREQARARRALLSQRGRGDQAPAVPTRPPRQGALEYAPKVTASETHGGQSVTGSRIGRGTRVTGEESGAYLPVSGTQYIGASDGAPIRSGGPKVGLTRTAGGAIVSGMSMRGNVRVTGDEPGTSVTITGESDQIATDDVTPRAADNAPVTSQFNRQMQPHGQSVFGSNVGRSATSFGSRERARHAVIESTENGLAITGSAVGRGGRVTGDETGVCRQVTGNQYLTPARAQAECGGSARGAAPFDQGGLGRRDPVTGAKVSVAQTWGQQRLTGTNVEHDPRVTGEAAGSCANITGTSYQGPHTIHGWCEPHVVATAEAQLPRREATCAVTGDVPHHSDSVTGTARGAGRDITGSPYFRAPAPGASVASEDAIAALDARFSISSPQRTSQLRSRASKEAEGPTEPSITGSFAVGRDRVTGNAEFHFSSRGAVAAATAPAHSRLTGEGRTAGTRVSGWSWEDQANVSGTDGATATNRNASERAGQPQAFSGARRFKALAKNEDTKQLVTGLLGWSGKTAAKVTLSGGSQA